MFPENPKSHEIGTRHQEQVQFAHTGRLQKSTIIYAETSLLLKQNNIHLEYIYVDVECVQ